jgi:hypothetical protein
MLVPAFEPMGVGAPELLTEADSQASPTENVTPELRWRRRPLLRAAIRATAVLAPAVAAVVASIAFARFVPPPSGIGSVILWWVGFFAAFGGAWLLTGALLQRTLPLASLLDLTLVFPNSVPSRWSIRRRANRRRLEADLKRLRRLSDPDSGVRAQLILELAVALSIHDSRTRGHSERVRMYTDLVARELGLHQSDADRLRWAALLHDIGKLAVAPEILNKPGLPDDGELESIRNHPLEGFLLIAPLHKWLGVWAATVRDHHERFDGSGYPAGLRGPAISLGGRIVAVTDSYETMTAGRPYRKALSIKAAREELVRRSGSHFDPDVVRAFLAISYGRLGPVLGFASLIAPIPFLAPVSARLSQLGPRSVSGLATAGAAVILVAAGLVGPPSPASVFGPSGAPATAGAILSPNSPAPPGQGGPSVSPSAVPSAPNGSGPPASGSTSPSNPGGAPAGGTSGGGGAAAFPGGISKHPPLPRGIAKQTNPFAQWRIHH